MTSLISISGNYLSCEDIKGSLYVEMMAQSIVLAFDWMYRENVTGEKLMFYLQWKLIVNIIYIVGR